MDTLCFPVKRRDHFMYPEAMFRTASRKTHGGIDCTPIVSGRSEPAQAIESGVVVIADLTAEASDSSGIDVMILGDITGIRWWYGHFAAGNVRVGQRVTKGQHIGYTGSTGNSSGCHLHLEAHYPAMNIEIDPWLWLWNAPDVDGSLQSLMPTREKAVDQLKRIVQAEEAAKAAANVPQNKPAAAPLMQEEDDMKVVHNTKTGHIYYVKENFIRHETDRDSANYAVKVFHADDKFIEADEKQFAIILNALAIPEAAAEAVLRGKFWTPLTGVADARTMSLSAAE